MSILTGLLHAAKDTGRNAVRAVNRNRLSNAMGEGYQDAAKTIQDYTMLRDTKEKLAGLENAKQNMRGLLSSPEADSIVAASKEQLPAGSTVYRGLNSESDPLGNSFTTDYATALSYAENNPYNVVKYILKDNDRYISPKFTEPYQQGSRQNEVILKR